MKNTRYFRLQMTLKERLNNFNLLPGYGDIKKRQRYHPQIGYLRKDDLIKVNLQKDRKSLIS